MLPPVRPLQAYAAILNITRWIDPFRGDSQKPLQQTTYRALPRPFLLPSDR